MEKLLSSLSVDPQNDRNIFVREKTFSKEEKIEFLAGMRFDKGPLKGKDFLVHATGEPAIILNKTLDLNMHCNLHNEDFYHLLTNFKEGSVVTLREGDFILRPDRVFPLVRTVLSSVRMLNKLKTLEIFEKLSHSSRFAVVARIEAITYLKFYNGCPSPRCHFKSMKEHVGSVFLDCPKCGEQTENPILSTVFNIDIENGNYKEDITVFNEDVLRLTGEKKIEDVEKLFYENKAELFSRFVGKSFVFVVRPDIYGTAEWKVTAVFNTYGRGSLWISGQTPFAI